MNYTSRQIIPDSQAVIHNSDGTFMISDLLKSFKTPVGIEESFIIQLKTLHSELQQSGYSRDHYLDKIKDFFNKHTNGQHKDKTPREVFDDGIDCNLLQPDGKGWQKGKLKLCFEFIPEEAEPLATQEKPVETQSSPLDEIRQLANELTSII